MLAEKSGNGLTSTAIIKLTINTIVEGLDEDDKERVWLEEAEMCEHKENPLTARAIYFALTDEFRSHKIVWVKAVEFERRH